MDRTSLEYQIAKMDAQEKATTSVWADVKGFFAQTTPVIGLGGEEGGRLFTLQHFDFDDADTLEQTLQTYDMNGTCGLRYTFSIEGQAFYMDRKITSAEADGYIATFIK